MQESGYHFFLSGISALLKMAKALLVNLLGNQFLSEAANMDIRLFIPKHPQLFKKH